MKITRVFLALVIVAMLMGSLITGCGSGKNTERDVADDTASTAAKSTSAESTVAENPFKEHMDISIAQWDIEADFPADKQDAVYDIIKQKFNITVKPVNTTWEDYTQKIQVWAASSQLPDVFVIDAVVQPYQKTWIKEGLVRQLPGDLSQYPNIQELLAPQDFQAYKASDGRFYCLPKPTYAEEYEYGCEKGIYYRKDWMANVGITKAPENTDEFIALMKAFMEQDPDKNGKSDTIGLTAYDKNHLLNIMLSFVPGLGAGGNQWIREDGIWIPSLISKQALPGIKELKRVYDAGCVDKDIVVLQGDAGLDKFASGRAGALAYGGTPGFQQRVKDKFDKNYPDKKYEDSVFLTHYWKSMDGNYYRYTAPRPWSENYFNAKTVDDKKMERILYLSDWLLSEEGLTLMRFGIEGKDYTKQGDEFVITRAKTEKGDFEPIFSVYPSTRTFTWFVTWDQSFDFVNPSFTPEMRKMSSDIRDWCKNEAKPIPTDFRLDFLEFPSKTKVTMNAADDLFKIIAGKDIDKAYNDVVKGYRDQGLQQVIDELNNAAAAAGIN